MSRPKISLNLNPLNVLRDEIEFAEEDLESKLEGANDIDVVTKKAQQKTVDFNTSLELSSQIYSKNPELKRRSYLEILLILQNHYQDLEKIKTAQELEAVSKAALVCTNNPRQLLKIGQSLPLAIQPIFFRQTLPTIDDEIKNHQQKLEVAQQEMESLREQFLALEESEKSGNPLAGKFDAQEFEVAKIEALLKQIIETRKEINDLAMRLEFQSRRGLSNLFSTIDNFQRQIIRIQKESDHKESEYTAKRNRLDDEAGPAESSAKSEKDVVDASNPRIKFDLFLAETAKYVVWLVDGLQENDQEKFIASALYHIAVKIGAIDVSPISTADKKLFIDNFIKNITTSSDFKFEELVEKYNHDQIADFQRIGLIASTEKSALATIPEDLEAPAASLSASVAALGSRSRFGSASSDLATYIPEIEDLVERIAGGEKSDSAANDTFRSGAGSAQSSDSSAPPSPRQFAANSGSKKLTAEQLKKHQQQSSAHSQS